MEKAREMLFPNRSEKRICLSECSESFAALLKEDPTGCNDTVLPDPLLTNHSVKCLTFEEYTRMP